MMKKYKTRNNCVKLSKKLYNAEQTSKDPNKNNVIGKFYEAIARLRGAWDNRHGHACSGCAGVVKLGLWNNLDHVYAFIDV